MTKRTVATPYVNAVCIAQLHQITHYLSLHYSLRQRGSLHCAVFAFTLQFAAAAQFALCSYIKSLIVCRYITVCGSGAVCIVQLHQVTHFLSVCGSGAVCIVQLHQVTHYLSLHYSLRQRRSLHCAVASNH